MRTTVRSALALAVTAAALTAGAAPAVAGPMIADRTVGVDVRLGFGGGHGGSSAPDVWVLSEDGRLSRHDGRLPLVVKSRVTVRGLVAGDELVGIDVRPATGALYALGALGQLYTIDTGTGAATAIGAPNAVAGRGVGFDFNPTVDRIRVITSSGTDLRLHPDTGALAATDGRLAYAPGDRNAGVTPRAAAAGYTNSVAGATTTVLYDIDAATDSLVTQGNASGVSPNTGQLFTVGKLGLDVQLTNGFDISGRSGTAVAAVQTNLLYTSVLVTIDLRTGKARLAGPLGVTAVGLAFAG